MLSWSTPTLSGTVLLALGLAACDTRTGAEAWDGWFDEGNPLAVTEAVEFTTEPYGFPSDPDDGIAALLGDSILSSSTSGVHSWFAPADLPAGLDDECENWDGTTTLPKVIEGVVTLHPRLYYKTNGCTRNDEKYYGSFFLEDDTGGVFILGDSKVAHFDMGDRIRVEVLGTRRAWGMDMVYSAQLLEVVEREAQAVHYEVANRPMGTADIGLVRRVSGTVARVPDTFGELYLQPDGHEGTCDPATGDDCAVATLDVELTRRGISFELGDRLTVTGPVLYSFSTHAIVVMRVGQLQRD